MKKTIGILIAISCFLILGCCYIIFEYQATISNLDTYQIKKLADNYNVECTLGLMENNNLYSEVKKYKINVNKYNLISTVIGTLTYSYSNKNDYLNEKGKFQEQYPLSKIYYFDEYNAVSIVDEDDSFKNYAILKYLEHLSDYKCEFNYN
jgi:hypothetical protein